ncbi:nardilysin-like [Harmonia axyridis]|uniref:nardilysin-like n=1 Tax=Harmonia axyridis TaxID=115357 RepID=UPI001E278075|nr:nardilysin-like [Harmonia axyridis]
MLNVTKYIRHIILKKIKSKTLTKKIMNGIISNQMPEKICPKGSFEVLPPPVKSCSDRKEYRVIRLENGLVACLIADTAPLDHSDDSSSEEDSDFEESSEESSESSDVENQNSESENDDAPMKKVSEIENKMAAAALCVGVGSFSDPKDVPGLAHFLEHMVFMGSSKYPAENDFDSFIKKRGGSDNASTDCETTVFYFECLEKHLYKALDKFAQFFIEPLMLKSAMTREREAIESEFQMALPKDSFRKEQLLCSLANADTPVNSFAWGNLVTLRDNISDDKLHHDAHKFRQRHYSAHRMTVAIQARLPMDDLQNFVLESFSEVPSNKLPPDNFDLYKNKVYDTAQFPRLYYIKPQKDICQLDLTWCLPSLLDKYRTKPHQYVSWLIGDEGKGSLLSFLKKKVWALAIYTGNGETGIEHNSMYSLFSISLVLTAEGLNNIADVITAVFSYLNMLKQVGPQERLFKELQTIEEISFKFSMEESPMDYVEQISEAMHFYKSEDYITGSDLYFEYDPEGIQSVMEHLTPDKMNIIVMSKNHKEEIDFNKKEKWFGTLYTDEEIPPEWIDRWQNAKPDPDMNLPLPNQFLTTDFELLPDEPDIPEYPEKILETPQVELWYRKDQKFKLPVAHYHFYLISPLAVESALSICKMEMFMNLFIIQIAEDIYPAQVAELLYSVSANDRGLVFKVYGFNQKLPILVEVISQHLKMMESQLTSDMFEAVKEKLANSYYNKLIKPSTLTKDLRLSLLMDKYFTPTEKFSVISQITFEEMKKFCVQFLEKLYVKALVQGNVDKDTALRVIEKFISDLSYAPLEKKLYPQFKIWELPQGEKCCRVQSFNQNDSNSIVTNYYQSGPFNLRESVILELIMMIIEEPLFDILRTKEQLGYHVFCTLRDTFGILGYSITVNAQATKNTTSYVDQRIENFIKAMNKTLKKMSEKKFNQVKRDLIKMKQSTDVVLEEEVSRNWVEILGDDYMFDRLKKEIAIIETIRITDLRKFWENINLLGNQQNHRKLTVQVVGFNINSEESSPQKTNDVCEKNIDSEKDSPLAVKKEKPVVTFLKSIDKIKHSEEYFICDMNEFRKNLKFYPVSPNQLK